MADQITEQQASQEPVTQKFDRYFHHEGRFQDGTQIIRSDFLGQECLLVVKDSDVDALKPQLDAAVTKYESQLPQVDFLPNGLSRKQAANVLAAAEVAVSFNGGIPDEHTGQRNQKVYTKDSTDPIPEGQSTLGEFKGSHAMTCVETATLTQQLLADKEEITHVSGAAKLYEGGNYEPHTFNLIKPADPKYESAVLDIVNPIVKRLPDGTTQPKQYCAPLTTEQYAQFKEGKQIELDYGGEKRTYTYHDPNSFMKPKW